jgi:hypothetical protein
MDPSKMKYRFAREQDLLLLAELNHQLICDERADNPMPVLQLQKRMRGWLASQYQAVLFEVASETVGYALFRVDEEGCTFASSSSAEACAAADGAAAPSDSFCERCCPRVGA